MRDKPPVSNVEKLLDLDKEKKRQFSFYLDEHVYAEFMRFCKRKNVSGSKVVSALIQDFLAKFPAK